MQVHLDLAPKLIKIPREKPRIHSIPALATPCNGREKISKPSKI